MKTQTPLRFAALAGALGVILALGGCIDENPNFQPGPLLSDECRRGDEVLETFEDFESPQALDILVLVDNSSDMKRAQEAFADALPAFLEDLEQRGMTLRLGVLTTEAGASDGLAAPGIEREGCARNTGRVADSEGPGDWSRVAACNVVRTDAASPRQQALGVLADHLVARPDALADFLRPRARLLLLVLTNEDDCSSSAPMGQGGPTVRDRCAEHAEQLDDVAEWVRSVRAQAATDEGVMLAVLSGPPSEQMRAEDPRLRPVCQGTFGPAYPANRLWQAAGLFDRFGLFQSLCTDALSYHLSAITEQLVAPARMTLCPAQKLVHEPLDVALYKADASVTSIPLGEGGFLYSGASAACANGALSLSPEALRGVESVEVRYCVD